jgi:hypothetical protein
MATPTLKAYGNFPLNLMMRMFEDLNAAGSKVYGMLADSSYVFNQDAHTSYDDVAVDEVSGTGYTAHGAELIGKYVSYSTRISTFGITTPYTLTFSGLTIPDYRFLILYNYGISATHTLQKLMCCYDTGQVNAANASNVVFGFNSSGIITFTVGP